MGAAVGMDVMDGGKLDTWLGNTVDYPQEFSCTAPDTSGGAFWGYVTKPHVKASPALCSPSTVLRPRQKPVSLFTTSLHWGRGEGADPLYLGIGCVLPRVLFPIFCNF